MDELNPRLPTNLDATLTEFFAGSVPDPDFAARLEVRLQQRRQEIVLSAKGPIFYAPFRNPLPQKLRVRPLVALFLALLALLALTGIAYALGWFTGFIPGFGFTANNTVFVLEAPVETNANGLTLQMNQAVNDGEKFWVELDASSLPKNENFSHAFILLPNGQKVLFTNGGRTDLKGDSARLSYLFPAITGQPQNLTLWLEGSAGQNFSLPFKMRPIKVGEIVPALPVGNTTLQSDSHDGVRLVVDHIAVDSNKTVFQVSLNYDRPNTQVAGPWNATLSDKNGVLYPLADITPDTMDSGQTHIYRTSPFTGDEQLLLTLVDFQNAGSLSMLEDFSGADTGFTFDPGDNPQAGQTWQLDEHLQSGPFKLHLIRATLTAEPGLLFEIEPSENVTGIMLFSIDSQLRGSTGGKPVKEGNFTAGMTFDKLPTRPFKIQISRVYYSASGTWQIRWQPPAAPTPETTTITPSPAPSLVVLPTPTRAAAESLLFKVQQLAQKFDLPFQQGPAWVHVVTETNTPAQSGQTYPPPYLKTEQWIEVDKDGYITRFTWLDFNQDGQIIQQSATVGNLWVNFSTGTSGNNDGTRNRFSLDGLTHDLSTALQGKEQVIQENVLCENQKGCLLVTILDTFPAPIQNPGEPEVFYGAGRRVWIDDQTGQQVKSQSFWRLKDGSDWITSTQSTLLVEKLDSAPKNILTILGKVTAP